MPIVSGDIEYRLSGGASNTDPDAALGGAMSTVGGGLITSAVLNNLWDDVSGAEASAGDIEYRCIYILNSHGSLSLQDPSIWIQTITPSTFSEVDLALAGEGLGGTAEVIANESTAPVGETFTHPITKGGGLLPGTMTFGNFHALWIRRTITAAAPAFSNDGPTLRIEGETAA